MKTIHETVKVWIHLGKQKYWSTFEFFRLDKFWCFPGEENLTKHYVRSNLCPFVYRAASQANIPQQTHFVWCAMFGFLLDIFDMFNPASCSDMTQEEDYKTRSVFLDLFGQCATGNVFF